MTSKITKLKTSHLITLPKIEDEGFLSFAENKNEIPFKIKRIYYIYDVIKGAIRGKHAHKKTEQVLFCLKGKIKIKLDNGKEIEEIILDQPNIGVYLGKMLWHEMHDFEKDTLLLVVASDYYKESDYIRNYNKFLHQVTSKSLPNL